MLPTKLPLKLVVVKHVLDVPHLTLAKEHVLKFNAMAEKFSEELDKSQVANVSNAQENKCQMLVEHLVLHAQFHHISMHMESAIDALTIHVKHRVLMDFHVNQNDVALDNSLIPVENARIVQLTKFQMEPNATSLSVEIDK